jgi:hypothetical protein
MTGNAQKTRKEELFVERLIMLGGEKTRAGVRHIKQYIPQLKKACCLEKIVKGAILLKVWRIMTITISPSLSCGFANPATKNDIKS